MVTKNSSLSTKLANQNTVVGSYRLPEEVACVLTGMTDAKMDDRVWFCTEGSPISFRIRQDNPHLEYFVHTEKIGIEGLWNLLRCCLEGRFMRTC